MKDVQQQYVIEARDSKGQLLLGDYPQPYTVFGDDCHTGMPDWRIARIVFAKIPDAILNGSDILNWPRLIDPNWVARVKTW